MQMLTMWSSRPFLAKSGAEACSNTIYRERVQIGKVTIGTTFWLRVRLAVFKHSLLRGLLLLLLQLSPSGPLERSDLSPS
jgi:hypothetical protein